MTISRTAAVTMLGAAAVTAQCVAGKATRDALFLSSLGFAALPSMLVGTSLWSIVLLTLHARVARRIPPAVLLPGMLVASGLAFLAESAARSTFPGATAVIVYLHVTGSTSLLVSAFWLLVSERFDPRTAKRRLGHVAGAGTLGGLLGAVAAERVAAVAGVPAMLLFLAGFQFVTAWLVRQIALPSAHRGATDSGFLPAATSHSRSALRIVAETPYLRRLAGLVLLGTTSAALLEFAFKAKAVETFGVGDNLLRFFALYYAGTSLVTFILQTTSSRYMLERFGLGLTSSTPSIAVLAGGLASVVAPGLGSLLVARGGESILRGAWFRSGYELFYSPMPVHEKRAAKSVVDVGFDRLGDAVGGGLIRVMFALAPAAPGSTIVALAMIAAAAAIFIASGLNHWYVQTLETSLMRRRGELAISERADDSLKQRFGKLRRQASHLRLVSTNAPTTAAARATARPAATLPMDPELQDAAALRAADFHRARKILSRDAGLSSLLVHQAIPLLGVAPLAEHAMFALCKVAEEHVGTLGDALLDPRTPPGIRLRLARVFAVCISQRAADVLMVALEDDRFDVRFQAARSLAAIRDKNPRVRLDRERVHQFVLDAAASRAASDDESLAHVFTLLSLVMAREPLRIAYQSLLSDDRRLRGTALEYLEGVLPPTIRQRLWPLLLRPAVAQPARAHDDSLAERLTSAV